MELLYLFVSIIWVIFILKVFYKVGPWFFLLTIPIVLFAWALSSGNISDNCGTNMLTISVAFISVVLINWAQNFVKTEEAKFNFRYSIIIAIILFLLGSVCFLMTEEYRAHFYFIFHVLGVSLFVYGFSLAL